MKSALVLAVEVDTASRPCIVNGMVGQQHANNSGRPRAINQAERPKVSKRRSQMKPWNGAFQVHQRRELLFVQRGSWKV